MKASCGKCFFFEHTKWVGSERNQEEGICRRFPPNGPLSGHKGKYEPGCTNTFPIVVSGPFGDWCGEFQMRTTSPAPKRPSKSHAKT